MREPTRPRKTALSPFGASPSTARTDRAEASAELFEIVVSPRHPATKVPRAGDPESTAAARDVLSREAGAGRRKRRLPKEGRALEELPNRLVRRERHEIEAPVGNYPPRERSREPSTGDLTPLRPEELQSEVDQGRLWAWHSAGHRPDVAQQSVLIDTGARPAGLDPPADESQMGEQPGGLKQEGQPGTIGERQIVERVAPPELEGGVDERRARLAIYRARQPSRSFQ